MSPLFQTAVRLVAHAGRLVLAAVFLTAGVVKSLDPEGFGREVAQYGLIGGSMAQAAAYVIIPVEIALGVALALAWRPRLTFAVTAAMLVMFMGAIGFALATDQPLEGCGCFGRAIPRTPQQTLAEDALFLALAVLGWVALGGGAKVRPGLARRTWKAAAVMASAVVSGAFALASPHLPIDDAVTELKPGIVWNDLGVALAEEDLGRGTHLVALLGMKDEKSLGTFEELNRMSAAGQSVIGLYGEDEAAYHEVLWTRAPAFPLYNVSPSDMRRLHRRLPRFFAVTQGRVAATWDRPPTAESLRAAVAGVSEAS